MKKAANKPTHVTTGNVLDDLGFTPEEAMELKVRAALYDAVLDCIEARGLTQGEVAEVLGIHQPDASNLLNGRISKFSISKLIRFAGRLDMTATVKVAPRKQARQRLPVSRTANRMPRVTASAA